MPDTPCGSSSRSSSGSMTGGRQAAAASPGYGRHFAKVTLTVSFRVTAGRQFDRTYWFQIGKAVVSCQGSCCFCAVSNHCYGLARQVSQRHWSLWCRRCRLTYRSAVLCCLSMPYAQCEVCCAARYAVLRCMPQASMNKG
jgi:hypothetical protein